MKIALVKNGNNALLPAYDSDYEYLQKLRQGDVYFYEVKKERNLKFHRKLFALFNMVYDNQEHYTSLGHMRNDLMVSAGHYDVHYSVWGEEIKEAKSLSFSKMTQDEFDDVYRDISAEVVKHFNFDDQSIADNIQQYF